MTPSDNTGDLLAWSAMTRVGDHQTSIEAARRVSAKLSELQRQVLQAFRDLGPMTDGQLEELPIFDDQGPSTIRKRRSELYRAGLLVKAGRDAERSMTIWAPCSN